MLFRSVRPPMLFRGIVIKVEMSIDAQSANATTTFTVAYLRRKDEEGGDITMTEHPIYESMPQPLGVRLNTGLFG